MSKSQEIKLTNTQLKLLKIISCYMGISPSKTVYLNLKFICTSLDITDRQLRTVRKGISHLFDSKWRKATKIDGVIRKNVYVFKPIENNLSKTSELKGQKLPTSNKEDKNLNKNIDLKSKSFDFLSFMDCKKSFAEPGYFSSYSSKYFLASSSVGNLVLSKPYL